MYRSVRPITLMPGREEGAIDELVRIIREESEKSEKDNRKKFRWVCAGLAVLAAVGIGVASYVDKRNERNRANYAEMVINGRGATSTRTTKADLTGDGQTELVVEKRFNPKKCFGVEALLEIYHSQPTDKNVPVATATFETGFGYDHFDITNWGGLPSIAVYSRDQDSGPKRIISNRYDPEWGRNRFQAFGRTKTGGYKVIPKDPNIARSVRG